MSNVDTDIKPPHAFSPDVIKRLLAACVPLVLVLGAGLWVLDHQNRVREGIARQYEGTHIVGLQAELMISRLQCCKSDLLFLAEHSHMHRFLAGEDPGARALANSSQLFERNISVEILTSAKVSRTNLLICPVGWLPALNASNLPWP